MDCTSAICRPNSVLAYLPPCRGLLAIEVILADPMLASVADHPAGDYAQWRVPATREGEEPAAVILPRRRCRDTSSPSRRSRGHLLKPLMSKPEVARHSRDPISQTGSRGLVLNRKL